MRRHNICFPLSNLSKCGLRHLKVLLGEIAPPAIIGRKPEIRRAEICSSENNRRASLQAPQDMVNTSHLIASPTVAVFHSSVLVAATHALNISKQRSVVLRAAISEG